MSSYIHFYIRNNDIFLPLLSYSRSNSIYNLFRDNGLAPFEKVRAIKKEDLTDVRTDINEGITNLAKRKSQINNIIDRISSFNNSTEEKLEALNEYEDTLEEIDEAMEESNRDLQVVNLFDNIIEEAEYNENGTLQLDSKRYIYCGIDCSFPTKDDIIGE